MVLKTLTNNEQTTSVSHTIKNSDTRVRVAVKKSALFLSVIFVAACTSTPSAISTHSSNLTGPDNWQAADAKNESIKIASTPDGWLKRFDDQVLEDMVAYALEHNYQLQAQRLDVAVAKERLNISAATDFPELSLAINNSRRKLVTNTNSYQTDAEINLNLSYEVDLWGKLSSQQTQDRLTYAVAQANYQQSKLNLVADISKAWFDLIQAQQLLNLYQERAQNLQKNLTMIQSSYQLGLNDALDVYLTQNDVNQELARVAQQLQTLKAQSRILELLLGEYPNAHIVVKQLLPIIDDEIDVGVPAQLITRRADILASWYDVLALDAGLAVAHKQRFPSFTINASIGDNANELENLLDGGALAWSLLGNISTPLFNAGKLASLEQQARLAVEKKEQQYLQQVYQAFSDVENGISNRDALTQQYYYFLKAQDNALTAEKLSFDQYLRGLVTYTTVLESQRRAFDAQTSVIQLTNQLLQNRINIYTALGGDYISANDDVATEQNTQVLAIIHPKSLQVNSTLNNNKSVEK
jgi:NodT family efflux transporter outer membrane factor (OMF) lipoprotein